METYNGHVRTPQDAIILFEACRLGVLPRVQRRLSEKERQQIRSGSVFVWDEREAGMRRWTDGKSWSASRVSGSFLTYREMEGKRGGSGFPQPIKKTSAPQSNDGSRSGENDGESGEDGPDGYRYKPDGLMKQSFSITTNNGQHLHLISYYARSQPTATPLKQPSNDPSLRHIHPVKGMYPEATVNESQSAPAVTRGPMSSPPFAPSPQHLAVAPPHGPFPLPPGYPHAYPIWPGSPVGGPPPYGYYIPHPPPGHAIAYPYYHPHAPPPVDNRPPHLQHLPPHHPPAAANGQAQPIRHSPYYSNGYPPQGPPPPSSSSAAPPHGEIRSHLPSPGLASAKLPGPREPGLQIPQINEHKPLTPPLSASNSVSAAERPRSPTGEGASNTSTAGVSSSSNNNNNNNSNKVLPAIGTLINPSSEPASAPAAAGSSSQGTLVAGSGAAPPAGLDANRSRQSSRSPDGAANARGAATALQPGPATLAMSNDTAGMMAIRALNGRFHKPTT